jgi:hypothetical protein
MQRALEAALGELVFGPPLDTADRAAVGAFLQRHALGGDDRAALEDGELERLLVYRELVRGTLKGALEAAIPRSMARLGARFDVYFQRFVTERGSTSHYLRDVTGEFLDFCASDWAHDPEVPPYLLDLARHEALHIRVAAAAPEPEPRVTRPSLALDEVPCFIEAALLSRSQYAVHKLPEALEDRSEPELTDTNLLAYRSPEHEVRYLELTPLAAALLERWLAGETLGSGLTNAAAAANTSIDPALLEATARLLADLSERGVLLGTRTTPAPNTPAARQP